MEVTDTFRDLFGSNAIQVYNQRVSRLEGCVTNFNQEGERYGHPLVGQVEAYRKGSRHERTKHLEENHFRSWTSSHRMVGSTLVDEDDDWQSAIRPESVKLREITQAVVRAKDPTIIEGLLGNAYRGEDGTDVVALPDSQKVAVDYQFTGGGSASGLTLDKMRKVRSILGLNEADGYEEGDDYIHCACTQYELDGLLRIDEVINDHYAEVKALVDGKTDYFMGIHFKRLATKYLPLETGQQYRQIPFWVKSSVVLSTHGGLKTEADKLASHSGSLQLRVSQCMDATRIQDEGVVSVSCLQPSE